MSNNYKQELNNSTAIREEIKRFEGVHPNIYTLYDLLQNVPDDNLRDELRDLIIKIEGSFVNSQEWTLSKSVPEIRLGILGSMTSGKSALVHRFLTGTYCREESPEGGRFKKEIIVDNQSHLILLRDEGGPPEEQFSTWVDGVIFVFSLADETSFHSIYNYYRRLVQFRNVANLPFVLVGTQDFISTDRPRVIFDDRAKKLASDLKRCVYYETCSTYGLNVDKVFQDVSQRISLMRKKLDLISTTPVAGYPTPLQRSISTSSGIYEHNGNATTSSNGSGKSMQGAESSLSISGALTPTPLRKSIRRKSNLFSGRKSSESSEEKKRVNGDLGFGRNIPVKQGWLLKRTSKTKISNKEWKKKYVALEDDGSLSYYSSMNHYMENNRKKSLSVIRTTIKVPGRHPSFKSSPSPKPAEDNCEFHLVSMDGVTWQFQSQCADDRDDWVTAIERQIMLSLQNSSPCKRNNICGKTFSEVPGNCECVDCGGSSPTWASLNLGCLMCIECSGIHRNLGTHISRVRSLELDDWPPECSAVLEKVGNFISNSIWESSSTPISHKPNQSSSREQRELFIRDKYINKAFLEPLPQKYAADISATLCFAIADSNYKLIMHLLAYVNRDDLNRQIGSERQTPLHVASSVGDLAAVQLLLWLKANPCLPDALGQTPISLAEENCHWECVRVLTASKTSQDGVEEILPQRCSGDATSSESRTRSHINYMYTSAI